MFSGFWDLFGSTVAVCVQINNRDASNTEQLKEIIWTHMYCTYWTFWLCKIPPVLDVDSGEPSLLTFSPCKAGTESRKLWKLSLMWSRRLRSRALWCARLSACKTGTVFKIANWKYHRVPRVFRQDEEDTPRVSPRTRVWRWGMGPQLHLGYLADTSVQSDLQPLVHIHTPTAVSAMQGEEQLGWDVLLRGTLRKSQGSN